MCIKPESIMGKHMCIKLETIMGAHMTVWPEYACVCISCHASMMSCLGLARGVVSDINISVSGMEAMGKPRATQSPYRILPSIRGH